MSCRAGILEGKCFDCALAGKVFGTSLVYLIAWTGVSQITNASPEGEAGGQKIADWDPSADGMGENWGWWMRRCVWMVLVLCVGLPS